MSEELKAFIDATSERANATRVAWGDMADCHFCGAKADEYHISIGYNYSPSDMTARFMGECDECGAMGPVCDTPEESLSRWNAASRTPTEAEPSGYIGAFYDLAKMLGIGARATSPKNVWEREMRPRIAAALRTPTEPGEAEVERLTDIVAMLRKSIYDLQCSRMTAENLDALDQALAALRSPTPASEREGNYLTRGMAEIEAEIAPAVAVDDDDTARS